MSALTAIVGPDGPKRNRRASAITALLWIGAVCAGCADLNQAKHTYASGRTDEAVRQWDELARRGFPRALYERGRHDARSTENCGVAERALRELETAYARDVVRASFELGRLYGRASLCTYSHELALLWFRRAADHGYASAEMRIARLLEDGDGSPDPQAALMIYRRLAERGSASALYQLSLRTDLAGGHAGRVAALELAIRAARSRESGAFRRVMELLQVLSADEIETARSGGSAPHEPGDVPTIDAAELDGPDEVTVTRQITVPGTPGKVADVAVIEVSNVPPIAAVDSVSGGVEGIALVGLPVALAGSFDDVAADTHTAVVDWDDGSASAALVDDATDTLTASHTYSTAGTRFVDLVVTDDDGGQGGAVDQLTVYDAAGAVGAVIDRIDDLLAVVSDHEAETALLSARKLLDGNLGGRANEGALDKLESGDSVAALRKIEMGVAALQAFEEAEGSELAPEKQLLALAAQSVAQLVRDDTSAFLDPSPTF